MFPLHTVWFATTKPVPVVTSVSANRWTCKKIIIMPRKKHAATMHLGASFVRSLQGGAGCVAADESWRRGQKQFILAVLLQAASSGHLWRLNYKSQFRILQDDYLPGQRTSSLQDVCTVLGCSRQGGVTDWGVKADVVLGVPVPDAGATFPLAPKSKQAQQ